MGRGRFITGFFGAELNLDVNALDKSASLDEDTSLEPWSSFLCVVESARLVVGFFNLDNSEEVTLMESKLS